MDNITMDIQEIQAQNLLAKKREQDRLRQAKYYANKKEVIQQRRKIKRIEKKTPSPVFTLDYTIERLRHYFQENQRLTQGSEIQYIKNIKSLFQVLGCENLESLNNYVEILDKIKSATFKVKDEVKEYKTNSKKAFIQTILFCIDKLNIPLTEGIKSHYVQAFETFKLDSIDENEDKQLEKSVYTLPVYLKKIKDKFGELSKEYVMVSLYNEITIRDDFHLKIITSAKQADNPQQNYIIIPQKKTLPLEVIINTYKTQNKYEQLKFLVKRNLKTLIKKYIDTLPNKEYLFGDAKKNSDFVSKMNKEIGVNGGISEIRKMKISTLLNKEKIKDNAYRVQLARDMGHSPNVQLSYLRKLIENK